MFKVEDGAGQRSEFETIEEALAQVEKLVGANPNHGIKLTEPSGRVLFGEALWRKAVEHGRKLMPWWP